MTSLPLKTIGTRFATIVRDEALQVAVEAGALLEVMPHPNPTKYPRRKVMVVKVAGYAYLVPFVEEDNHFFLKTTFWTSRRGRLKKACRIRR